MITTHRRQYLDNFLCSQKKTMKGDILDVGGKKENKRGYFLPPYDMVSSWRYINIDQSTNPDICCDAERIPLSSESIDGFLLCEVLEHLKNPEAVLSECYRLLRYNGCGWITMPFLYQIHADPMDYQRWTDSKLKDILTDVGFSSIVIEPMGGFIAVTHDLLFGILYRLSFKKKNAKVYFKIFRILSPHLFYYDSKNKEIKKWITTGWSVVVKK